jgi:hypothetical protein
LTAYVAPYLKVKENIELRLPDSVAPSFGNPVYICQFFKDTDSSRIRHKDKPFGIDRQNISLTNFNAIKTVIAKRI